MGTNRADKQDEATAKSLYTCPKDHTGEPFIGTDGFNREVYVSGEELESCIDYIECMEVDNYQQDCND